MKNQKGQAAVEFAFVAVLFFTMCFGMIYGGIAFMDYLQYNNAARAVARVIAIETDSSQREKLANDFKNNKSDYINQLTNLYTANPEVEISSNDVTVTVELTLSPEGFPALLSNVGFPPKKLTAAKIIMPLEHKS